MKLIKLILVYRNDIATRTQNKGVIDRPIERPVE